MLLLFVLVAVVERVFVFVSSGEEIGDWAEGITFIVGGDEGKAFGTGIGK